MDCFAEPCHRALSRDPLARNDGGWIYDDSTGVALLHHRGGLPEQQLALFLGADRRLSEIRIDLLGPGVGTQRRRPLADGFEPALQMREVVDVLALVLV